MTKRKWQGTKKPKQDVYLHIPDRNDLVGERISVLVSAVFNIGHYRESDMEEIEFKVKWRNQADTR